MARSSNAPPGRLLLILAAVAAVTLAVVGALLFRTRSTVVEIEAEVQRFEVTLAPPERNPEQKMDFLAPSLRTRRLDLLGAGSLEAFLDGSGRITLRPGPDDVVRVAAGEPFQPLLSVFGPTRIALETAGQNVRIEIIGGDTGSGVWSGAVPAGAGLDLEMWSASGENIRHAVSPDAPDLILASGRTKGVVGLSLPEPGAPATVLRLVDTTTGGVTERRLPFGTSEARALAWGDRLAFLEPESARPEPLLRPCLKAVRPRFFRSDRFDQDSFITGGKIRFPGGEKGDLDLDPRVLLSLRSAAPLTLGSVVLRDGRLAVTLWGRVTSLKLGPTPELQREELPSLFVWLCTHHLSKLLYSTLGVVLTLSVAVLKILGFFKNASS